MKKFIVMFVSLFLLLGIFTPTSQAAEQNFCDRFKDMKKIWWNGAELKPGQIGRLTVLKDTSLYKLDGDKKTFIKTLKKGEFYRIYAFKPGMLGLGGGYYIDRDTKVKYETPNKEKLEAAKCVNVINKKYPPHIKSIEAKMLISEIEDFKKKYSISDNRDQYYKDLIDIKKEIENAKISNDEKNYIIYISNDLDSLKEVKIDHIIIKFANGDKYKFYDDQKYLLGLNEKFGNEIYLKFQTTFALYGLLTDKYETKNEDLPGEGIKGNVYSYSPTVEHEKIYIDKNDINSKFYYVSKAYSNCISILFPTISTTSPILISGGNKLLDNSLVFPLISTTTISPLKRLTIPFIFSLPFCFKYNQAFKQFLNHSHILLKYSHH